MRTFKFIGMAAMAAFMSMGMISCGDDSLQSITEAPEEVEKPADKDLEFALSEESENLVNNEVSIGAEGKELGISFATNTDWNAKVSFSDENAKEWCSITPINGKAGVNSLRIKIDRNKEVDRSTKITILLESASDQSHISEIKLNVTQSYMDTTKKLHIETAGTLPTLMSGEESKAVKELTLSGFINGIDIKFIRYMKNLVKIDLSDVNIVSGGDDYWFTACGTGVEIADNVFPMGFFEHLKYLEEIKLPNSIVEIEKQAFYDWKNRISIDIPNGVTTIGAYAFTYCTNLTSVSIPGSVTAIKEHTFEECTNLESVKMANGITLIDEHAFRVCTSLRHIDIPSSVDTIKYNIFQGCTSLASVNIADGVTVIEDGAFSGTNLKHVDIPKSVIEFGSAFSGCASLASVNIADGITIIEGGAFSGCSSLTSVNIPNSVTIIEDVAFHPCISLKSINISNNITTLGAGVFLNCVNLTSITIPSKVIQFGTYYTPNGVEGKCFYGCTALKEVHIKNPNPPAILEDTFSVYADATLYVPIGSKEAYQNHSIWGKFGTIIEE